LNYASGMLGHSTTVYFRVGRPKLQDEKGEIKRIVKNAVAENCNLNDQ